MISSLLVVGALIALDAGQPSDAMESPADSETTADAGVVPDVWLSVDLPKEKVSPPSVAMRKVTGRVLTRGTRAPVVAARIALDLYSELATESDDNGFFNLDIPADTQRLYVQCPEYYATSVPIDFIRPMVIRLEPRLEGERYTTVVTADPEGAPSIPIEQDEMRKTAGSMGDPFRVVESFPGVTQAVWPLPLYAIRGANPGNTGYFIDNVRAPALFHFALGPSVIHPFFLEQIEFFSGGYPIEQGRYVSGIVTAKTATPATDRLHVSADIRLFDAGGIAAAPFHEGLGSVAVAGRYSYTGYLLSSFSSAYSLDYWDYQVRIEHLFGPGKLTLFAFGSGDGLRQKKPDIVNWGPGIVQEIPPGIAELTFHRLQLRWVGNLHDTRLTLSFVAGTDDSKTSLTSVFTLPIGSQLRMISPRVMLNGSLAAWLDWNMGADAEWQWITPSSLSGSPETGIVDNYKTDLFTKRKPLVMSAFSGITLRLGSGWVLMPGMRYDFYSEDQTHALEPSPRLSGRWRVNSSLLFKTAVGQFSQLPSLPVGVPGFESFGLKSYGLQRSRQVSVGVESLLLEKLGLDLQTDVSVFYQRLRLSDMRSTLLPDPQAKDLVETRRAESYGVEFLIRRSSRHRIHGWLAYTLSWSNRLVDGIVAPSDWDQRHIINIVTAYRLPKDFSVSVRFHYNTGRPYPLYDARSDYVEYSRLPSFPQLDLRGDKRFRFDQFIMDVYLEVINSTLSREVYDRRRELSGEVSEEAYRLVLPSAGVHIEW